MNGKAGRLLSRIAREEMGNATLVAGHSAPTLSPPSFVLCWSYQVQAHARPHSAAINPWNANRLMRWDSLLPRLKKHNSPL